jgi:hypothetical protein
LPNLVQIFKFTQSQKTNSKQMKAIILISSIFYILGLKVSNKIDLVKRSNPVEKIISNTITSKKSVKSFYFKDETDKKAEADTLKRDSSEEDKSLKGS